MDKETELKIMKLKLMIEKKDDRIKHLNSEKGIIAYQVQMWQEQYERLEAEHQRLKNKFEANFAFHHYIKDVLDQTADLMKEA